MKREGGGNGFLYGTGQLMGGCVFAWNSSPTIIGCVLTGGAEAGGWLIGGGIFSSGGSPRIEDCEITLNQGGGIVLDHSTDAVVVNCSITFNTAVGVDYYGERLSAGLTVINSGLGLYDSTISFNRILLGNYACAGLDIRDNSSVNMNGCTIRDNVSNTGSMGGVRVSDSVTALGVSAVCANTTGQILHQGTGWLDSSLACVANTCSDSDSDGVQDCLDQCPGVPDTDSDGDGVMDCNDGCPDDPDKTEPGDCGCGNPDVDTDGDGVLDCNDGCPDDPDKTEAGACGCGNPDVDSDGDGLLDCDDPCPNWFHGCSDDGMTYYVYSSIGGLNHVLNNLVPDGGTIQLDAGTFTEWWLNPAGKAVTIRGAVDAAGNPTSIIQASNVGPVFRFDSGEGHDTVLENLWLQNGSGQTVNGSKYGGLVYCVDSSPAFKNCHFSEGTADYGGGVYASNSAMLFENCKVSNCTASASGFGFYFSGDTVSLEDVQVCELGNDPIAGAYIDLGGNSICETCNDADSDGMLDCADECPYDPYKTEPGDCGCGVDDVDTDGDGIADCIDPCPSWVGGCSDNESILYVSPGQSVQTAIDMVQAGGTIQLESGVFAVNNLNTAGKAVTVQGDVDGSGAPMSILDAQNNARVVTCNSGETAATVFNNLILRNGSSGQGGAVQINNSAPTFEGCIIENSASDFGGGVYCIEAVINFTNCTIQNNTCSAHGAGLYAVNTTGTMENCSVTSNQATSYGGGLCLWNGNTITMVNLFLQDNTAYVGAGVYLDGDTAVTFIESEVSGNHAIANGGGINSASSQSVIVESSVICGNTPQNTSGSVTISDDSCVALDCGADSDGDGVGDCDDECPGEEDIDSDGDGVVDCNDQCPDDPYKTEPGDCGCGVDDVDTDSDGIPDCNDECPDTPDDCTACTGDFTEDGAIDIHDLLYLVGAWGAPEGDLNDDGTADIHDLLILIAGWGECP